MLEEKQLPHSADERATEEKIGNTSPNLKSAYSWPSDSILITYPNKFIREAGEEYVQEGLQRLCSNNLIVKYENSLMIIHVALHHI